MGPFLGLFTSRPVRAGQVITVYGGDLCAEVDVLKKEPKLYTHVRRIPGSIFVRDGLAWSSMFDRTGVDFEKERELPPCLRARVLPLSNGDSDEKTERILSGGIGYMINTGPRCTHNVRCINVNPSKDGIVPDELFIVSSRDIDADEELIAPYNNNEFKMKF